MGDAEIQQRLARGDLGALKLLQERHGAAMYAVAYQILGCPSTAAEAVRQAFAHVWRSRAVTPRHGLAPWLCEVTCDAAGVPRTGGAPDRATAWATWGLRAALGILPPADRQLLELATRHQCTAAQIAERTGLPVDAVTSRLGRVRRALAAAMARSDAGLPRSSPAALPRRA
ncbi:RNA polymerase sigma factor [Actinokineospora sp. 24-640]